MLKKLTKKKEEFIKKNYETNVKLHHTLSVIRRQREFVE